jgi:hypothetical protein
LALDIAEATCWFSHDRFVCDFKIAVQVYAKRLIQRHVEELDEAKEQQQAASIEFDDQF